MIMGSPVCSLIVSFFRFIHSVISFLQHIFQIFTGSFPEKANGDTDLILFHIFLQSVYSVMKFQLPDTALNDHKFIAANPINFVGKNTGKYFGSILYKGISSFMTMAAHSRES